MYLWADGILREHPAGGVGRGVSRVRVPSLTSACAVVLAVVAYVLALAGAGGVGTRCRRGYPHVWHAASNRQSSSAGRVASPQPR